MGVGIAMAVAAVGIVTAYLRLDEAPEVVACRVATHELAQYRGAPAATRQAVARDLGRCGQLDGATAEEVRAALGPPPNTARHARYGDDVWIYGPGLPIVGFDGPAQSSRVSWVSQAPRSRARLSALLRRLTRP